METEALDPWVIALAILALPAVVVVMVVLRVSTAVIKAVLKVTLLPMLIIVAAIAYYQNQAGGAPLIP